MKRVPIVCVETGERFESISEAARARGFAYQNLQQSLGAGTACRGLHYVREHDQKEVGPGRARAIPVLCVETGEVYESISAAARALGLNPGQISTAVSGRAGGVTWKRA